MLNQKEIKRLRVICHVPLLALCLSSTAWAQNSTSNPSMNPSTSPSTNPSSSSPSNRTSQGATDSQDSRNPMSNNMDRMSKMTMSGDVDRDFATMMKMHHQHGVEMAEMQLKNGKSPEMKKIAKQMVSSHNKEMAQFDTWLSKQK